MVGKGAHVNQNLWRHTTSIRPSRNNRRQTLSFLNLKSEYLVIETPGTPMQVMFQTLPQVC